jgi:hypothetical protein
MAGLVKVAALAAAGFWRAGRHWPHDGVIVDTADLADGVLKQLMAEPMLRVTPVDADQSTQSLSDEDLNAAVKSIIEMLDAEEFGQDGKPKIPAIKKRLPEAKDRITVELRDAVWASLAQGSQ